MGHGTSAGVSTVLCDGLEFGAQATTIATALLPVRARKRLQRRCVPRVIIAERYTVSSDHHRRTNWPICSSAAGKPTYARNEVIDAQTRCRSVAAWCTCLRSACVSCACADASAGESGYAARIDMEAGARTQCVARLHAIETCGNWCRDFGMVLFRARHGFAGGFSGMHSCNAKQT
jgi:hypothetical protein